MLMAVTYTIFLTQYCSVKNLNAPLVFNVNNIINHNLFYCLLRLFHLAGKNRFLLNLVTRYKRIFL